MPRFANRYAKPSLGRPRTRARALSVRMTADCRNRRRGNRRDSGKSWKGYYLLFSGASADSGRTDSASTY